MKMTKGKNKRTTYFLRPPSSEETVCKVNGVKVNTKLQENKDSKNKNNYAAKIRSSECD